MSTPSSPSSDRRVADALKTLTDGGVTLVAVQPPQCNCPDSKAEKEARFWADFREARPYYANGHDG